jgi:hypothetical protein
VLLGERRVVNGSGATIGYIEQRGDRFAAIDPAGKSRGTYASSVDATRALPLWSAA